MGFTPETITAPSVPDGLDPLKYLTARDPQSKAQETAQAEARQLAHGGSTTGAQCPAAADSTAVAPPHPALDTEAKQSIQEAKTTRIPARIDRTRTVPVEYPYFFSVSKSRSVYHSMPVSPPNQPAAEERAHSVLAPRKAPVHRLTRDELALGPQYIERIRDQLEEFGLVKLVMPEEWVPQNLPFSPEYAVFKPFKQAVVPADQSVAADLEQMTSGFVRAIIRFHTASPASERKVTKLPYYERRPIDLYRLFCTVRRRGGHSEVTKRKEWAQVGRDLGYSSVAGQTLSSNIRNTYTRVILPFKQWLTDQLGPESLCDPRIMPRIDVMDYRMSHLNMDDWTKLEFDIVIEKPPAVPLDGRQFVEIPEPETQTAYTYLKQFKQASSRCTPAEKLPVADLESAYTRLPKYFAAELSPDIKLFPYPQDANKLIQAGSNSKPGLDTSLGSSSAWDPWDFSSIPFRNNELASLIEDNVDDLCVPRLNVGGQFATTPLQKPLCHTYLISTVVDGSGRTWYTQDGTWTDQHSREIVIVHPKTEFTHWCHGYSAEVSVNIIDPETWLPWATQNAAINKTVCIPRLIANIATSAHTTPKLNADATAALEHFVNREKQYTQAMKVPRILIERGDESADKGVEKATGVDVSASSGTVDNPVVCSKSGEKLFFSWVVANDTIYSPAYFLENPVAEASFFQRSDAYFHTLQQRLEGKPATGESEWLQELQSVLSNHSRFPGASEIWKLVQTYPIPADGAFIAAAMRQAIANSYKFIHSEAKVGQLHLAEADDEHQAVQSHANILESAAASVEANWEGLITALASGDLEQTDAKLGELYQTKHMVSPSKLEAIKKLLAVPNWVDDTIRATSAGYSHRALFIKNLRLAENVGHQLGLTYNLPLMNQIRQQIHACTTGMDQMKALVTGPDILVPGMIQKVIADSRDWYTSPTEDPEYTQLVRQFKIVVFSLPLIERMYHPVVTERPKRSEMAQLAALNNPSINGLLDQLQMWLDEATKLDWITIATQVTRISQGAPPAPETLPASPISVTSIVELCRKLYTLLVVCDDIINVQSTLVNALGILNNVPIQLLAQYGFAP